MVLLTGITWFPNISKCSIGWFLINEVLSLNSTQGIWMCGFDRQAGLSDGEPGNCSEEPGRRALLFHPHYSKLLFRKCCFPSLSDWNLILHWGLLAKIRELSLFLSKPDFPSKLSLARLKLIGDQLLKGAALRNTKCAQLIHLQRTWQMMEN